MKGLRQVIICHTGEIAACVLPCNTIEGMETQQILSWLKQLPFDGLKACRNYFLRAGDALYCPFGSMCLLVGLEIPDGSISEPQKRKVMIFKCCAAAVQLSACLLLAVGHKSSDSHHFAFRQICNLMEMIWN